MNKIEYRQKAFEILSYVKLRWNLSYIIVREHTYATIRANFLDSNRGFRILLFLWLIVLCLN